MTSTPRQRFKSANPPHLFPSQFELNYGCREFLSADACFVDVGPTKFRCQTGHVGGHRTHCPFLRVGGFRQVEGCSRCRVQPMQISVGKSWGLSSFSGRCCLDRSCLKCWGHGHVDAVFPCFQECWPWMFDSQVHPVSWSTLAMFLFALTWLKLHCRSRALVE